MTSTVKASSPAVLGKRPPSEVAEVLRALGDTESAAKIDRALKQRTDAATLDDLSDSEGWPTAPWQHTEHVYGYIPKGMGSQPFPLDIQNARGLQPDLSLKNADVKVTLDWLRVYDYPGGGQHFVLFEFSGDHQADHVKQDLCFTQQYRVQEGEAAGVTGFPIFIGLNLGKEGIGFRCKTVNVANVADQKRLAFLDSDVFKKGLSLINGINPVLPIVTEFATSLVSFLWTANTNVPVQEFDLGLDFSSSATRAKIKEGSYIVVQAPALHWDWSKWVYNTQKGLVVERKNPKKTIPYNYIIFSVTRMESET